MPWPRIYQPCTLVAETLPEDKASVRDAVSQHAPHPKSRLCGNHLAAALARTVKVVKSAVTAVSRPTYWTLTATSRPSKSLALCTCRCHAHPQKAQA